MTFKPETGTAWLRSPVSGRPCLTVEGDADAIEEAGEAFRAVGAAMRRAARELGALSREERYVAQGFAAIRDEAGQAETDLERTARRYVGEDGTGGTAKALCDYASALRVVQFLASEGHVEAIRSSHEALEARRDEAAAARSSLNLLESPLSASEPSEGQLGRAEDAVEAADRAASGAESLLEGLWENFDSALSTWESAYDDAVAAIDDAIDLSDIDDSWWEDALDVVITIASVVGFVAAVLAMIVAAPFAAILATIATIAGLLVLVATLVMAIGGRRKDGVDVALAVVGVLPFGKALATGQGFRGALGLTTASSRTAATAVAGRTAIVDDLARWQAHGTRHADVLAGVGNRAARAAAAGGLADDFLRSPMPVWTQRLLTGMRTGGTGFDTDAFRIASLLDEGWAAGGQAGPRSLAWAADNAMPGLLDQGVNVWNFGMGALDVATLGDGRDVLDGVADAVTGR